MARCDCTNCRARLSADFLAIAVANWTTGELLSLDDYARGAGLGPIESEHYEDVPAYFDRGHFAPEED